MQRYSPAPIRPWAKQQADVGHVTKVNKQSTDRASLSVVINKIFK